MADVLLGRTEGIEGFERHVVLKRIRAEHARDERFISMFIDEARLGAGLHHQAIVQVFDIGETNGEYFFAMEYIHGEDVRKLLASAAKTRAYVPLQHVCFIVSAVAAGLHYAHERRDSRGKPLGIVHRDVSPSNILIGYDGSVKIVDFGIAKATLRQTETIAGSLKGKCAYMSPEQCKGEPIDRRSDVYGLGVLLYEIATTSRLFKADNEYLIMDAVVNGRFAMPQVRRPDPPNELASIIMRALATDPDRRYQTAEEMRLDLEHFAATSDRIGSTATLASYMKKMFGERPEPWLDLESEPEPAPEPHGWSDAPRAPSSSDRWNEGSRSPTAKPVGAADTAQSLKLGWEATHPSYPRKSSKLAWLAVPVIALAGFGAWKLAEDHTDAPRPAVAQVMPPTPAATAPVLPAATAAVPAAPAEPPPAPAVAAPAEPPIIRPEPEKKEAPKRTKKAARASSEVAATETRVAAAQVSPTPVPAPQPTPQPAAPVVATPPPVAAPAPAPAVPPTPPAPKEIELVIPTLSYATVAAMASDHASQIARCESGASLRGDVAVSFQIDAAGKVVRTQLASTIKNPKVAGCILRAVSTWKFAKPPSGSAKGVYSISYQ